MEGKRAYRATPLDKATLEGTVRMPQVGFGIRLHAIEHCLSSEDPKQRVAELIKPIPLNEGLAQRTKKANAQHAHHAIGRALTEEEVRRVQAAGNLQTLKLIGETLGQPLPPRQMITFDVDGTWSDPELDRYLLDVQAELTPEHIASLRKIFDVASEVLAGPEVQSLLKERKEAYQGWKDMTFHSKTEAQGTSRSLAEEVRRMVIDKLYETRQSAVSIEEQHMFTRAIFELNSFAL